MVPIEIRIYNVLWVRAAQTVDKHRNMNAYLALAGLLSASVLALPTPQPRERFGYEREIIGNRYNQVPKLLDYVLNEEYVNSQKNRPKLVTKLRPEDAVISDNIILESNVVKIVKPAKKLEDGQLVRQRRGYNLENVIVPARYPYLPVVRYNRFRRWG
ncbi:unnamed protein product [Danaus chrysippus]|uniref:(African queen) hypothetical protein n=1 Tax=Danaus chrysippus TaxID=151541 RepID=A0A8J2QJP9_9NEOP|nr:unnamed protein product [Danaus chrysippus]